MRVPATIGALLLLSGCHRAMPDRAWPPIYRTSPPLEVYDDFEQPRLGLAWERNRFEDGAVVPEKKVARAGRQAIAVTVRSRDKFEAGRDGDLDTERDELLELPVLNAQQGAPYETTFSMYFPLDFPIVPTRLVIAQWKQTCPENTGNCSNQSPVLALRYIGGELLITQALAGSHYILFRRTGEFRGRWLDFRVRYRFTPNSDGHVAVWLNGSQLVDHTGPSANAETPASGYPSPGTFFFKMGLYRDLMPQPMTVYIDDYRKRELATNQF